MSDSGLKIFHSGDALAFVLFVLLLSVNSAVHSLEPQKVKAGVSGYVVPVEIRNPGESPLNNLVVAISSVEGPLENASFDNDGVNNLAPGESLILSLGFDVNESAEEGELGSILLNVIADETGFDDPAPKIMVIVEAVDEQLAESSTTSEVDGNVSDNTEDTRKLELYFVLRVEGSGYIPHWGGGSWHTSGFYETWFVLPYDASIDEKLPEYIEAHLSRKHPGCDSSEGWRILFSRDTPIVWQNGPQVTVTEKGPFTLADGSEKSWVELEKSEWERTDSKVTLRNLWDAICG